MSVWKLLGILFAILLGLGVILFVRQTFIYYQAIRSGAVNPVLDQRLEYTVSRLVANRSVKPEDLATLADPQAPSQGSSAAPMTIVEFVDYSCPVSRKAFEVIRELAVERAGQVRLVIRDFPLEDIHPGATKAAVGARCAQEQGKFWAYYDKLFLADQRSFVESDLFDIAREIGLDMSKFTECVGSGRAAALVQADQVAGLRAGIGGTPTFFFNNEIFPGLPKDPEALRYVVDSFLAKTASTTTP